MPQVAVYNMEGSKVGDINLKDDIFAAKINEHVMHNVVKAQLANQRQGTQSALTRSEVRGGGIKPWRQKGTGRARQGSIRAPQWRKGGVVFAPKPRSYRQEINRKEKRLAMKSALSVKVAEDQMLVLDSLELAAPKTKEVVKLLKNLDVNTKALIVLPGTDTDVERAARNLPGVKTLQVGTLNVLDILNYDAFIITRDAVARVEEVYV
ncbi:MAG: 50S ribosomal protein L4 [Bacillota bacterium]